MLKPDCVHLGHPILQFGTSRFLQAHVDLFVSEALEMGQAVGRITVVQSTGSTESSARTAALAAGNGYPVRIRGLSDGRPIDETRTSRSIGAALHADAQWPLVRREVADGPVQLIVSNTGDTGWKLDDGDTRRLLDLRAAAPRSYPAKLLVLLYGRWQLQPTADLCVLPCELVSRNGETLRQIVVVLASQWHLPADFIDYLQSRVVWANSLVDRIVAEPLHPVGAVAEPYALWAIERQPGLGLPCTHPAIVVTDDLAKHERLKLYLLNLGHTVLAESWLRAGGPAGLTVLQAMQDRAMRANLEAVWSNEVLPVFEALGERSDAESYLVILRERLSNPFLEHRLADIAQNHTQKKQRRFAPVVVLAEQHLADRLAQPWLRGALASKQ